MENFLCLPVIFIHRFLFFNFIYYLKKYHQFFEATLSPFMAETYLEEQIVMYSICL